MKLLNRISESESSPVAESPGIPDAFSLEQVRSVEDCMAIFESLSWLDRDGLSEHTLSTLLAHCDDMRRRGLELEPNLVGRAVSRSLRAPQRIGKASISFGARDGDFIALVAEADKKRDLGDHRGAEFAYFSALRLYPEHPSILVQYAHVLKEQQKYTDALVYYLDAATYGVPPADVVEHARFLASGLGVKDQTEVRLSDAGDHLSSSALRLIYRLLFGREAPIASILELMLESPKLEQVLTNFINRSDFKNANRDLLRVVAETAWRPQGA